jgi:hypothetical protein
MSLASGAKLGPCEILSVLGAGREGGRVYRARVTLVQPWPGVVENGVGVAPR